VRLINYFKTYMMIKTSRLQGLNIPLGGLDMHFGSLISIMVMPGNPGIYL